MNIIDLYRDAVRTEELISDLNRQMDEYKNADIPYGPGRRHDCSIRSSNIVALQNQISEIDPETRLQFAKNQLDNANSLLKQANSRKEAIIERKNSGNPEPGDSFALRILERVVVEKEMLVKKYTARIEILNEIDEQEREHNFVSLG